MVTLCPHCNSAKTRRESFTILSETEADMTMRMHMFCSSCKRSFYKTTKYGVRMTTMSKDAEELMSNEFLLNLCNARKVSERLNVRPDSE